MTGYLTGYVSGVNGPCLGSVALMLSV